MSAFENYIKLYKIIFFFTYCVRFQIIKEYNVIQKKHKWINLVFTKTTTCLL